VLVVNEIKIHGNLNGIGTQGLSAVDILLKFIVENGRPGDYVALNAYLPRNPRILNELQMLRKVILEETDKATTLGFGPRFQHSTGQLHKGGSDEGIFVQIVANPFDDCEIPNEDITFGELERAQADGDLEALEARKRRVIRLELPGPDAGILVRSLEERKNVS